MLFQNIKSEMLDSDGAPVSSARKVSTYEETPYVPSPDEIERITIPPSTELIADEYEHEDNRKGLVLIFSSKSDEHNKTVLQKAFMEQNYIVSETNLFSVSTKDDVLATLKAIANEKHEDKTCLIVIFMANLEWGDKFLPDQESENGKRSISVKDVWSHFTADNCPSFKTKPKIFIFQAYQKLPTTETDSTVITPPKGAYDIPAEADMLIVYKKIESPSVRNSFMTQLCNNFVDHGLKDDIVGLVTNTTHKDNIRPVLISTLTRKFYITPSNRRGHHYDLLGNHDEAINLLEKIQNTYRSKVELRIVKKWQEAATNPSTTHVDALSSKPVDLPKEEPSQPKRVNRATSSTSSVDSKKKMKKTVVKQKPTWKY